MAKSSLAVLADLGIATRTTYGRSGGCDAPSVEQRLDTFRQRMRAFLQGDDDALLARQARGVIAHRSLVRRIHDARCRSEAVPDSRALVPIGTPDVRYVGPPRRSQRSLAFTRAT